VSSSQYPLEIRGIKSRMKFLFIEFFSLALSLDNLKGILSFSPDANKSKRLDVVEKKNCFRNLKEESKIF
jgi:hypothetical protein